MLALCAAAVLCGNTAIEDVTAWVRHAPQEILAAAGARKDGPGMRTAPHPDTVVRILAALGARKLARQAGAYLAARAHPGPVAFPVAGPRWLPAVAVDGKAVRGAAGEDGLIPYLLAACCHGTGAVLAERLIGPKTNEAPEFAPLLRELNEYFPLGGMVITADAGHTVKAHARLICEELLACYVLTVKCNTRKLWEEPGAPDWKKVPVQHAAEERGHGRHERRTIQVIDAPEHITARFPHARQAALIERYVTRWARVRNLAIGLIRQAGYTKIAATIRRIKYDTALLLAILGLSNPS